MNDTKADFGRTELSQTSQYFSWKEKKKGRKVFKKKKKKKKEEVWQKREYMRINGEDEEMWKSEEKRKQGKIRKAVMHNTETKKIAWGYSALV